MHVKELSLKNFRNYGSQEIEFTNAVNFFIGENGTGKTNIIEAISILSNIRSFRNTPDSEIIKWGESGYYCSLQAGECENKKFEVGCLYQNDGLKKKIKIDGREVSNSSEYYGKLLTVFFSPSDISIIYGPPEARRRFIDSAISKIDSGYIATLLDFKKVLANRNSILRNIREKKKSDDGQLDVWDGLFTEKASVIIGKRKAFIERYASVFTESYKKIMTGTGHPYIKYEPSIESADRDYIFNRLFRARRSDIYRGTTGQGPQRDEYLIMNENGRIFNHFASQGQKRIASISLKISENEIIEEDTGQKSILLIDDIFSELDEKRRGNMIEFLNKGNQIIFTMVNSNFTGLINFNNHRNFFVEPGGIIKRQ
ncbi:MAG: DNA replication and repair protein RecF [Spirochaetes bacterium]|jgi:DNA replication and repair protein RecF|nr:DNA replication and repair protein RecF [Spirochaetota bacterium]